MDEISEGRRESEAAGLAKRARGATRNVLRGARTAFNYPFGKLKPLLPRGLFPRSLLIIVTPVVLLQLTVTIIFFERHYQLVTRRLSAGVAGEIAMLLSLYEANPTPETIARLHPIVLKDFTMDTWFEPGGTLPQPKPSGFFDILDGIIQEQLSQQITEKFWFDTRSPTSFVDIRIALDKGVLHILARRSQMLATNWHIFLVWMVLSSLIILAIAVAFLRNQVRPILRLARAAEAFGRGRDVPDFRPAGALEVRAAARALIDMRNRLSRYVDQRTDMLAGISHDMRTPLTRMRLQLAMLEPSPDIDAMRADLAEMEHMLEEYLAFARGEGSESVAPSDIVALIEEIAANSERRGGTLETIIEPEARALLRAVPVRRRALRRCITNILDNAQTYGRKVRLTLRATQRYFEVSIEDDGPGIPADKYEEAFKPFRRLDAGLRSGAPGSGLGLAISRDLARSHGGDIHLAKSTLGGLKASIRLPI